jgi:hypothetical protein
MRYGALFPYAGARPLQEYFLPANDVGFGDTGMSQTPSPSTIQNFMPAGAIIPAYDNYWGGVEFLYGMASATIPVWQACAIAPILTGGRWQFQMAPLANTANQARAVCFAIQQMAANQFGWFAVGGLVPAASTASVAAGAAIGIAGAGLLGADSAGKEIENANVAAPATTTVVKNALVVANQPLIQFTGNNTLDGVFLGAAVSGTGIPANAVVAYLDPDGRRFSMSTGPGLGGAALNPTASGGVALTFTYNDGTNFYNIVHVNRPFAQGRIT